MSAPAVVSYNSAQVADSDTLVITLTNAPSAGGIVVVLVSAYWGDGNGAWGMTASGGSGVTITKQYDQFGTTAGSYGQLIWTVEYSTAPTSVTINRAAVSSINPYISAVAVNVSGQAASYLDGVGGSSGSSGAVVVATGMPDTTDASDLILGVMTHGLVGAFTITPGAGWTEIALIDPSNSTQTVGVIWRAPGAAGTYDPTWSISPADDWRAAGISIKGASGGPPPSKSLPPRPRRALPTLLHF